MLVHVFSVVLFSSVVVFLYVTAISSVSLCMFFSNKTLSCIC